MTTNDKIEWLQNHGKFLSYGETYFGVFSIHWVSIEFTDYFDYDGSAEQDTIDHLFAMIKRKLYKTVLNHRYGKL